MRSYPDHIRKRVSEFTVVDVLSIFGKRIDHCGRGASMMFFSPFREEDQPSMHVDLSKNVWYDHGLGVGGGVIDMVCRLNGCSKSDAWSFLASKSEGFVSVVSHEISGMSRRGMPIVIDEIKSSFDRYSLLNYAESRGICKSLLEKYCSQVSFHFGDNLVSKYYAIGFKNDDDGWVLRSNKTKRCTKSGITTLLAESTSDKVIVFEGFFNFLSYLALYCPASVIDCNVCVLNSVPNLSSSFDFLFQHRKIGLWLDNDDTGKKAALRVLEESVGKSCEVYDFSSEYAKFNDLNDRLCAEKLVRNQKISKR